MAIGDGVGGGQAIAAGGTYAIRPSAGTTWLITNIGATWVTNPAIDVKLTNGSFLSTIFDYNDPAGTVHPINWRLFLTNDWWVEVTNNDAATATIAYSGVIVNE